MSDTDRAWVKRALLEAGIVGPHRSHPRRDNLRKIRRLVEGDEESAFGMTGMTKHSADEVLSFVAAITGCPDDIEDVDVEDRIDPDLTVAAIEAAAARLAGAARRGSSLLAVTGHPTGLLEHHMRVIAAYQRAGGPIVLPRRGDKIAFGKGRAEIRYTGGVGCLATGGSLLHTHSAEPMEALLQERPWPDLVLGDHGFAGAAIERDIPVIAVMDINDPALAVASHMGADVTIIPMDDNRMPHLYEPSWRLFEAVLSPSIP